MSSDRKYQSSHPWLNFTAKLTHALPSFWAKLGECQSKCEHIAGVPLRPDVNKKLHEVYLAKGVWGTTAIEGNTLSEEEVLKRVEGKLQLPPSKQYLEREIDNIIQESNAMLTAISAGSAKRLSVERIMEINALVLRGLELEDGVTPGQIRKYSVGVMGYRGAPHEDCEFLLSRLCEWINGSDFAPQAGFNNVHMAILKAIIAHLYLEWIHAFGDGNGRTGRMVEVQLLLEAGVPSPASHLLSNHYNATRAEYLRQLQRASQSGGDILPFVEYALDGLLDGLKGQLTYIHELQMDVAWVNYIHSFFHEGGMKAAQRERQKLIMLALIDKEGPVQLGEFFNLTPKLAIAYASKTARTLLRDIKALQRNHLLVREGKAYKANDAIMLKFLPVKASS